MKHNPIHPGNTAITIVLAISFLSLVLFLSYLFINSTVGR